MQLPWGVPKYAARVEIFPNLPPVDHSVPVEPREGQGQAGAQTGALEGERGARRGVAVVLRLIDNKIPTFDDLRVRELIRENIFPRQGLVIVAGETGSGKSTLLASVIHKILTDTSDDTPDAVLMELSDPIEFVYDSLSMGRNMIVQCAVGKRHDTKSFAQGIKNAKRMNTTHILNLDMQKKMSKKLIITFFS